MSNNARATQLWIPVIKNLLQHPGGLTTQDLCKLIGSSPKGTYCVLQKLRSAGLIKLGGSREVRNRGRIYHRYFYVWTGIQEDSTT